MASAEQPVSEEAIPAANLDVPLSTTPLYAQMVDNLADVDYDDVEIQALDELERTFMFGNVKTKEVPGHWGKEINNRVARTEMVLELLQEGKRQVGIFLRRKDNGDGNTKA